MRWFVVSLIVAVSLATPANADPCAGLNETAQSYLAKCEKMKAAKKLAPRDIEILLAGWSLADDEATAACGDATENLRSTITATLKARKGDDALLRRLTATCSRRYDGDDEELAEIVATRADQAKAMLAAMGADTAPCDGQ